MSHGIETKNVNAKDLRKIRQKASDNKPTSDVKKESLTVKREFKILGHKDDGLVNTVPADADAHIHRAPYLNMLKKERQRVTSKTSLSATDRLRVC